MKQWQSGDLWIMAKQRQIQVTMNDQPTMKREDAMQIIRELSDRDVICIAVALQSVLGARYNQGWGQIVLEIRAGQIAKAVASQSMVSGRINSGE